MRKNLKTFLVKYLKSKPLTKRAKIDTGFSCNINCFFCYYKKNLKDKFMNLKDIEYQLTKAKYLNFNKIDFSGGESSYHPDFFNMLKKAKALNFYITTLSNGIMFSNLDFSKKAQEYGLNEILFSVHGLEKEHNISTGGNNFKLIIKALENALKLNIRIRINTTIHSKNLDSLLNFYKFMRNNFDYCTHNFIFINTFEQNKISMNYSNKEKFKEITQELNNINSDIKFRYIPFCYVNERLHNKVFNFLQHFHDQDDWFPGIYYLKDYKKINKKFFQYSNLAQFIINIRKSNFYKNNDCEDCLYNFICDGYKK